MKTLSKDIIIHSNAEKGFIYMDNITNTGMHKTRSSKPMMGSKLELQQLSDNKTGLNSKFRWFGKMMGFAMDFTVVVTKWIKDKEKVWETIGAAKMIIMSWYQMQLVISSASGGQSTKSSINYCIYKTKKYFFQNHCFLFSTVLCKLVFEQYA